MYALWFNFDLYLSQWPSSPYLRNSPILDGTLWVTRGQFDRTFPLQSGIHTVAVSGTFYCIDGYATFESGVMFFEVDP